MNYTTLLITLITATVAAASTLPSTKPPNAVAREVINKAVPVVARSTEDDGHVHDDYDDEEYDDDIDKRAHRSGRGRTQTPPPPSSGAGMGKVNGAVLVAGVVGAVGAVFV